MSMNGSPANTTVVIFSSLSRPMMPWAWADKVLVSNRYDTITWASTPISLYRFFNRVVRLSKIGGSRS